MELKGYMEGTNKDHDEKRDVVRELH
jgi:hypothetical protein